MSTKLRQAVKSLIVELDYQKEFTYDQRVDFFNKWGISTSTKYFNPIMALCTLIELKVQNTSKEEFREYELCSYGMSHSGNVMTAFNKDVKDENKTERFNIKIDNERMLVLEFFKYVPYQTEPSKQFAKKVLFKITDTFSFKLFNTDLWFSNSNPVNVFPTIFDFITDFER